MRPLHIVCGGYIIICQWQLYWTKRNNSKTQIIIRSKFRTSLTTKEWKFNSRMSSIVHYLFHYNAMSSIQKDANTLNKCYKIANWMIKTNLHFLVLESFVVLKPKYLRLSACSPQPPKSTLLFVIQTVCKYMYVINIVALVPFIWFYEKI